MNDFKQKFLEYILAADSILVTSHMDPDGDAMGSSLATYFFIKDKYPEKKVELVFSSKVSDRWQDLDGYGDIMSETDVAEAIHDYEAAVFVDANYAVRFTPNPDKLKEYKGRKICIDHHLSKADEFDLMHLDTDATSASELVYQVLYEDEPEISSRVCRQLLMGLMSDTGNFEYIMPKNANVYSIAKRLVEEGGINVSEFKTSYSGYDERVFAILKEFMSNTRIVEVEGWPKFIISHIDRKFIQDGRYEDLEVNEAAGIYTPYLRRIKNVTWGFVARASDHRIKVSFRSQSGSVNVRSLVEGMGLGSGHDNAAGAKFENSGGELEATDCIEKIMEWMKNNEPEFVSK